LAVLVVAPGWPPRTEAWSVSGHQIIASRACRLFPGPWGDFFRYYESVLNETALYPDTFYEDRDPTESYRARVVRITATREGYLPGKLTFSLKTLEYGENRRDYMVVILVVSVMVCAPRDNTHNCCNGNEKTGRRTHLMMTQTFGHSAPASLNSFAKHYPVLSSIRTLFAPPVDIDMNSWILHGAGASVIFRGAFRILS